jgi:hypothetical protein
MPPAMISVNHLTVKATRKAMLEQMSEEHRKAYLAAVEGRCENEDEKMRRSREDGRAKSPTRSGQFPPTEHVTGAMIVQDDETEGGRRR